MSNIVRLPVRRPPWLFHAAGRLMVRADRPLADLHAAAKRLNVPSRLFRRGSGRKGALPYYRLTKRMQARCIERLGLTVSSPDAIAAIADACFRPRRGNPHQHRRRGP